MHNQKLLFTKMHGLGNDFIVINNYDNKYDRILENIDNIKYISNRNTGIGADQVLVIEKSVFVDFKYRIFNADGSEVEHCGNGARCFMLYVWHYNIADTRSKNINVIKVQTAKKNISTLKLIEYNISANKSYQAIVEVIMPVPSFNIIDSYFKSDNGLASMHGNAMLYDSLHIISMGNPHAVTLVDDVDTYPVNIRGAFIEGDIRFKQRVNAGFMQIIDRHNIKLRVFERGAGETLACGTGACAAVASGIMRGILDKNSLIKVNLSGGVLNIKWDGENHNIVMQGPASMVFEGEIYL
jgi:diaminopimelate epimerase